MSKKFRWVSDRYGVVVTVVDERNASNSYLFQHRDDGSVVALMLKHGADDKIINSYLIDRKSDDLNSEFDKLITDALGKIDVHIAKQIFGEL